MKSLTERIQKMFFPIIVICGIGYWIYYSQILEPAKNKERRAKQKVELSQRFKNWAYVAKEKDVAPGETIKLVIIPSPDNVVLDVKCLIYTHREFKTSSMICPNTEQSDLKYDSE